MCTSPSTSSSSFTKRPNWVIPETVPSTRARGGYFSLMASQGDLVSCFMPQEIFISFLLISRILTSTSSPARYESGHALQVVFPADVRNMDQAVYAVLQFDEHAELDYFLDLLLVDRADRELLADGVPRVRL